MSKIETIRSRFANGYLILRDLSELTPTTAKLFLTLVERQEAGPFSIGSLSLLSGLSRPTVITAKKQLELYGVIKSTSVGMVIDVSSPVWQEHSKRVESLGGFTEATVCVYCNEPFTATNPSQVDPFFSQSKKTKNKKRQEVLYLACRRCNVRKKDKVFKSIEEARRWLVKNFDQLSPVGDIHSSFSKEENCKEKKDKVSPRGIVGQKSLLSEQTRKQAENWELLRKTTQILGVHANPGSDLGRLALAKASRRKKEGFTNLDLLEVVRYADHLWKEGDHWASLKNLIYLWGTAFNSLLAASQAPKTTKGIHFTDQDPREWGKKIIEQRGKNWT